MFIEIGTDALAILLVAVLVHKFGPEVLAPLAAILLAFRGKHYFKFIKALGAAEDTESKPDRADSE